MKLRSSTLALVVGCAPTTYAYQFQLTDRGAHLAATAAERDSLEDEVIKAEIQLGDEGILVDLTNKSAEVLQVEWSKIALDRGDGIKTRLHPTVDLGWIDPGAKLTAQLVPFALPHTGSAAAGYEGRTLELSIPMVALHEPRTYRFHFVAHVHAVGG